MTTAAKLNDFLVIVEKHFSAVKAERRLTFPTRAEHSAMINEARLRAIAEVKAAD